MQVQRQEWSVSNGVGGYVDQSVKPMPPSARAATVTTVRSPAEDRIAQGVLSQGADFEAEGAVPMRLHLEISEAGGHLWIGTAQADPEQIAQAVAYVRQRLAARGIGLADITCNGKSWNGNLTPSAEQASRVNYPMDNQEFMAQIAQFTSLEQTQQINTKLDTLLSSQSSLQSVGLIGKTVEVKTQSGTAVGTVSSLSLASGSPQLTITTTSGTTLSGISLSQINTIR